MPDITMCFGECKIKKWYHRFIPKNWIKSKGCPLKEKCYRFYAMPDSRQVYFTDAPYNFKKMECEHLWIR